jgi:hypothetical protein
MTKSFFDERNIEDWKKPSPKDGALRFIEFMETAARDPSSDKALGGAEKKTLKAAREGLRPAFEVLIHSMGALPSNIVSYDAIWRLLAHSFTVGQHVGFLDERAQKVFEKVRAWNANAAHVAKTGPRNQALDDAIVAEAANLGKALSSSIEFARQLRPGVRERLRLPREGKDWPSEGTIKLAISSRIKPAKTNRVSPSSAKTNRVSR